MKLKNVPTYHIERAIQFNEKEDYRQQGLPVRVIVKNIRKNIEAETVMADVTITHVDDSLIVNANDCEYDFSDHILPLIQLLKQQRVLS